MGTCETVAHVFRRVCVAPRREPHFEVPSIREALANLHRMCAAIRRRQHVEHHPTSIRETLAA
eukprot:115607-Pyramimonas_sp.AAC.1